MSESLSLRERFARLGPVRDIDRVPSGSPERYRLEATAPLTKTITATHALARRHLPMIRAKRLIERLMAGAPSVVEEVPMVEDSAALRAELAACDIRATRLGPEPELDIRAVRAATGLTQEDFAWRYGLDLAALRNWEQGRTRPEKAVRSLFQVIAREPQAVERALET